MPDLKQAQIPNNHGCLTPPGCTLPSERWLPRVAVGNEGKGSFEAAFLVENNKLYETFANTVTSTATLKAWFACRLRAQAIEDGFLKHDTLLELQIKLPWWPKVWRLIRERQGI